MDISATFLTFSWAKWQLVPTGILQVFSPRLKCTILGSSLNFVLVEGFKAAKVRWHVNIVLRIEGFGAA